MGATYRKIKNGVEVLVDGAVVLTQTFDPNGPPDVPMPDNMRDAIGQRLVALYTEPVRVSIPPETLALLRDEVQAWLDAGARERGYDSILSMVSYRDSMVPKFRDEANEALRWRDAVWQYCNDLLAKVMAGQHPAVDAEMLKGLLPTPQWPEV